jgi:hypothetical protein
VGLRGPARRITAPLKEASASVDKFTPGSEGLTACRGTSWTGPHLWRLHADISLTIDRHPCPDRGKSSIRPTTSRRGRLCCAGPYATRGHGWLPPTCGRDPTTELHCVAAHKYKPLTDYETRFILSPSPHATPNKSHPPLTIKLSSRLKPPSLSIRCSS